MYKELPEIQLKRFAKNVKYLRQKQGLTMRELSKLCDVPISYICHIECYQCTNVKFLGFVAFSLGYHLADLLAKDLVPAEWVPE